MDDATAQGSKNQNGDGAHTHQDGTPPVQSSQLPSGQDPQQVVSRTPHKEHAPLSSEHVQITDPLESQPELSQEVKEAGVEAKHDEAHLHLTREHQKMGFQHSPQTAPVSPHITGEKQEFPMNYAQAEEETKKGSVWNSIRWLATLVIKQMKTKQATEGRS